MTIKAKINIFVLVAVLAPFSFLGYFTYAHSLRTNQARFGKELQSVGALAAVETNRNIERFVADAEAFAIAPLLRQALTGESAALLQLDAYFVSLRSRFPNFRQFRIANREGFAIHGEASDKPRRVSREIGVEVAIEEGEEPLL